MGRLGLDLTKSCFQRGQLCVGLSETTNSKKYMFVLEGIIEKQR